MNRAKTFQRPRSCEEAPQSRSLERQHQFGYRYKALVPPMFAPFAQRIRHLSCSMRAKFPFTRGGPAESGRCLAEIFAACVGCQSWLPSRFGERFERNLHRPTRIRRPLVSALPSKLQLPAESVSAATKLCAYHRDK
jgi:hypothetical protein